MEMRQFGKTDMQVSLLGFGGAEIGYNDVPQEEVVNILNTALDAGLNVIDTAECYPNSEDKIGNAISGRRSDFHLFSKVGHEHDDNADWSFDSITRTIDRSLKRLQTDNLDLILLHSCDLPTLKIGEAIEALQMAKEKGKTRYIGYSGDSDAAVYAVDSGRFDALEISINIADQEAIEKVLPLAMKNNLGVIVKRPLANAVWKNTSKPENAYHHTYWDRLQELQYPFLNNPDSFQTALRFTASVPGVHTMIVGTTNPRRWVENSELLAPGNLDPDKYNAIRDRWKEIADNDWIGQT